MIETLSLLSFYPGGWGLVLLKSCGLTLLLALCCLPLGIPLGLVLCWMIRSQSAFIRQAAIIFSTIFRGLPELLTLFLVYNGGHILLQKITTSLQLPIDISINAFAAGVIALGTVFAAFSSEVWLGACLAIDKGQYEAAKSLHLPPKIIFWRVILPQLVRHALPGLSNNWLVLLKDTSLVSIIALVDLMRQTNLAAAATKQPLFFYSIACLLYLAFSAISSLILRKIEQKVNLGYRKSAL